MKEFLNSHIDEYESLIDNGDWVGFWLKYADEMAKMKKKPSHGVSSVRQSEDPAKMLYCFAAFVNALTQGEPLNALVNLEDKSIPVSNSLSSYEVYDFSDPLKHVTCGTSFDSCKTIVVDDAKQGEAVSSLQDPRVAPKLPYRFKYIEDIEEDFILMKDYDLLGLDLGAFYLPMIYDDGDLMHMTEEELIDFLNR